MGGVSLAAAAETSAARRKFRSDVFMRFDDPLDSLRVVDATDCVSSTRQTAAGTALRRCGDVDEEDRRPMDVPSLPFAALPARIFLGVAESNTRSPKTTP
jgi:hypothetical protein